MFRHLTPSLPSVSSTACLLAVVFSGTIVFADETAPLAPNGKPWNFLIMLADDIGAYELGCYGHPDHQTPALDQLAREGVRFETAWVTPLCSPTRVMLMTGRYGFRTGWYTLIDRPGSPTADRPGYDLGTEEFTFADLVKTKGYATALAGKWQLTGKGETLIRDCGFDEYRMWAYIENLPPGVEHTGGWENRRNHKTARYWHPSVVENGKYLPTSRDDYGPDLYSRFLIEFMERNVDRPFLAYYPMALIHPPLLEVPDVEHPGRRKEASLKNNVEYMDHVVGRMVEAVDRLGLAENTLIFFIGDNGTAGDGKGKVTERGVRVPFIVRCPGFVPQGVVSRQLVSGTDVFPTVAELTGSAPPEGVVIDGKSLVPALRDPKGPHREWLFSYLNHQRMLRDERWLLEGDGRFFDCGEARDGVEHYRDVTNSSDADVHAARARFDEILKDLPAPTTTPRRGAAGESRRSARQRQQGTSRPRPRDRAAPPESAPAP